MGTFATLRSVQAGRTSAFPEKFADNPARTIALDTLQRRNAVLDAVFYDVSTIDEDETRDLAFWLAREGAIVVVQPTGGGRLDVYKDIDAFFEARRSVAALAVAGVGSSALGAAAFGRNVADAIGAPVAAVVSGYGLADVVTEAVGGFFWFGGLNSLRHLFEPLDAMTKLFTASERSGGLGPAAWTRTSKDTQAVIALLTDPRFDGRLLIGHSKGNLVLSEALYAIAAKDAAAVTALAERCRIVTVSAKIGMPAPFDGIIDIIDIMGQWDAFGAINSHPDIATDYEVPGAWHSTNPDFPFGMGIDVVKTLKAVLADPPATVPTSRPAFAAALDMPQKLTALLHA